MATPLLSAKLELENSELGTVQWLKVLAYPCLHPNPRLAILTPLPHLGAHV